VDGREGPAAERRKSDFGPVSGTVAGWSKAATRSGQVQEVIAEATAAAAHARDLNVFITTNEEQARAQARRSDENIGAGRRRPLEGMPLAIKDNFCTAGVRTTAGSRILDNFVPTYESGVTSRLLDAGAIFLGKTNMDEFGMGSSTEHSAYGPTVNPRGIALGYDDFVPGGSSGGSAAAVAADLCLAAIGTDTGGSIRQPASFCGVVGFKPTYGVCSRWGMIAYASSLDQAGVIAKNVEDAAILMDVIAGEDSRDSTSVGWSGGRFLDRLHADADRTRVAIPRSFREGYESPDFEALWTEIERRLKIAGAAVSYVDLPTIRHSLPAYYVIALCEASSNLARYDGVRYGTRASAGEVDAMYEATRSEGFGTEVKRRILLGTYALSAGYYDQYYAKAAKVRAKIYAELMEVLDGADFLVWPTAPTPAFRIGSHRANPITMYLGDALTVPVNLAGLPAVSIPGIVAANGMPMGFQIIGRRLADANVLAFARRLEEVA
jgi:aspartyl-tRNA(Asn)/glutamyl-tRNA(Gln) amidotransferase subunit A